MRRDFEDVLLECGIPNHMHEGLRSYIEHHVPPGGFLRAVLENDLKEACGAADEKNQKALYSYILFLYNHAPSACWGSPDKVAEWLKRPDAEMPLGGADFIKANERKAS